MSLPLHKQSKDGSHEIILYPGDEVLVTREPSAIVDFEVPEQLVGRMGTVIFGNCHAGDFRGVRGWFSKVFIEFSNDGGLQETFALAAPVLRVASRSGSHAFPESEKTFAQSGDRAVPSVGWRLTMDMDEMENLGLPWTSVGLPVTVEEVRGGDTGTLEVRVSGEDLSSRWVSASLIYRTPFGLPLV